MIITDERIATEIAFIRMCISHCVVYGLFISFFPSLSLPLSLSQSLTLWVNDVGLLTYRNIHSSNYEWKITIFPSVLQRLKSI